MILWPTDLRAVGSSFAFACQPCRSLLEGALLHALELAPRGLLALEELHLGPDGRRSGAYHLRTDGSGLAAAGRVVTATGPLTGSSAGRFPKAHGGRDVPTRIYSWRRGYGSRGHWNRFCERNMGVCGAGGRSDGYDNDVAGKTGADGGKTEGRRQLWDLLLEILQAVNAGCIITAGVAFTAAVAAATACALDAGRLLRLARL